MLDVRTLVRLDGEKYTELVRIIETATDAEITSALNRNIKRKFIDNALQNIGQNTAYIIRMEGDGALIRFDTADEAHKFVVTLHHLSARENITRPEQSKIWFRIGCATGEIDLDTNDGYLNAIVYRLEPKAKPGGILINSQMYNELSFDFQCQYDVEEIIDGKRIDERFYARRWKENSKRAKSTKTNKIDIVNRILDIPQISNAYTFSFESTTLNTKAEVVRREPREIQYLIEPIEEQDLHMIIVPTGEYGMGSAERRALSYEKPQHQVRVSAFLMSQHPITKAQWKTVATWPTVNRPLKRVTSRKGSMSTPVVNISWSDAVEFCDRLSSKTGYKYTLPTEAQWEYACRACTATPFSFGETITSDYANYDGNYIYHSENKSLFRGFTTSVEDFKMPNNFGLCNMHGNVWEWCIDHWHKDYHKAPITGEVWLDNHENPNRVMRGGSWVNEPFRCSSSCRQSGDEYLKSDNIGFRIVRSL
jgi:formylglycine-generating enzyme required for sulfatase activity/class 3 adenylate cyclase